MGWWVMRGVVVVQQLSVSCGVVVVQMLDVVFVQDRREMRVSGFMSCGTGLGGFGERHGNGCVQIFPSILTVVEECCCFLFWER
jgi:hypothetical protein